MPRGQNELTKQRLLPARQFVDGAYAGTQLILESRKKHGIEVTLWIQAIAFHFKRGLALKQVLPHCFTSRNENNP